MPCTTFYSDLWNSLVCPLEDPVKSKGEVAGKAAFIHAFSFLLRHEPLFTGVGIISSKLSTEIYHH